MLEVWVFCKRASPSPSPNTLIPKLSGRVFHEVEALGFPWAFSEVLPSTFWEQLIWLHSVGAKLLGSTETGETVPTSFASQLDRAWKPGLQILTKIRYAGKDGLKIHPSLRVAWEWEQLTERAPEREENIEEEKKVLR